MSDEVFPFEEGRSLGPLNSWHVGGLAQYYYAPANIDELKKAFSLLPNHMPVTWLGLGSNLLIRDGGVSGLVVHTKHLNELSVDGPYVYAQAGVPCAKLARFCAKHDFLGGEFFAGIPGTVGGALTMNAGAFGGQTWDVVDKVYTLSANGMMHIRTKKAFDIRYREATNIEAPGEAFVAATFKLQHQVGAGEKAMSRVKSLLKQRNNTQPIGTFNCGSVFKNPEGDHAARLIEASGLKGVREGGAIISEKHANFIINSDHASSQDVEKLMQLMTKTVLDRYGVKLEPEVRIIGQTRSVSRCPKK